MEDKDPVSGAVPKQTDSSQLLRAGQTVIRWVETPPSLHPSNSWGAARPASKCFTCLGSFLILSPHFIHEE